MGQADLAVETWGRQAPEDTRLPGLACLRTFSEGAHGCRAQPGQGEKPTGFPCAASVGITLHLSRMEFSQFVHVKSLKCFF